MPNHLQKLENNNIRSEDLYTGEVVQGYLRGDMTLTEVRKELNRRKKEVLKIVAGIDKIMEILLDCPQQVMFESEE